MKEISGFIKGYLKTYNLLLCIGWLLFLLMMIVNRMELSKTSLLLLNSCQLAAILEIVHAQKRWVKSPVFTTFAQVFSRVFVLILINLVPASYYITFLGANGVQYVAIAWGVTEIIRYAFYYTNLVEKKSSLLLNLRYTTFLMLYPAGVFGETLIIFSYLKWQGLGSLVSLIILGIFLSYFYFFPQMFNHMLVQREKKLGKG